MLPDSAAALQAQPRCYAMIALAPAIRGEGEQRQSMAASYARARRAAAVYYARRCSDSSCPSSGYERARKIRRKCTQRSAKCAAGRFFLRRWLFAAYLMSLLNVAATACRLPRPTFSPPRPSSLIYPDALCADPRATRPLPHRPHVTRCADATAMRCRVASAAAKMRVREAVPTVTGKREMQ